MPKREPEEFLIVIIKKDQRDDVIKELAKEFKMKLFSGIQDFEDVSILPFYESICGKTKLDKIGVFFANSKIRHICIDQKGMY
jgi:hypothetical protein